MIGMLLTKDGHLGYAKAILDYFGDQNFNIWSISMLLGAKGPVIDQKFCGRVFTGELIEKSGQVSMPMEPGGSVAWDLNTDQVAVYFDNDEYYIYRFLENRSRFKLYILTKNPI